MLSWLRAMAKWILTNRNRRIVTIVVFLNALSGYLALAVFGVPELTILTSLASAYAVSTLTMERYLTLGASCIAALQILVFLLLEPALQTAPLTRIPLLLLITAVLTLLMMSMITNIQQQEYFSTVESDRQLLYKATINALLSARGLPGIYGTVLSAVSELYGRSSVLFTRSADGAVVSARRMPEGLIIYDSEFEAARAAFDSGEPVGRFSEVCPYSPFLHMPLKSSGRVLAVLAILFSDGDFPDQKMHDEITGVITQAANAIERQILADEQQAALIETERERMRADFLRAISHDIRSPLTGIMSACSTLLQSGERINPAVRETLLVNIHEEADWLCHMVENLLSVTRVSGAMSALKKTPEIAEEVVGEVVARCTKRFPDVRLHVSTPEEPLLVQMDATLIIQVLMNLVENAVKYSGGSDYIELTVTEHEGSAVFTVRDYGVGLSPEMIGSLFTPINRTDMESSHGLGIGLSICRSVIRAHGGQITGENSPDKGAVFTFTLPMEETDPYEEENHPGRRG